MTSLERIYYDLHELVPGTQWADSTEVESAYNAVNTALDTATDRLALDDLIMSLRCAENKVGWIAGFRYAVSVFTNSEVGA